MAAALAPQKTEYPTRRMWTREEYYRAANMGLFHPEERLELIGGEVVEKLPQNSPHATSVGLVEDLCRAALHSGLTIRTQQPMSIGQDSDPEPDVAIVTGSRRDYRTTHPATALLVLEVADSSLAFDRSEKSSLYASAAVPEYLILNLRDCVLEVRRDPNSSLDARFGSDYTTLHTLGPNDRFESISITGLAFTVSEVLP